METPGGQHPLRTTVLLGQVHAGMWRRNGAPVANSAINYANTTNRVLMADLDLTMLQLGAATLPPQLFLQTLCERFGLLVWMEKPPAPLGERRFVLQLVDTLFAFWDGNCTDVTGLTH